MLLNRLEYALMNNPLRAAVQRQLEARQLLRMGGPMSGGRALEVGCGGGAGLESILELFHPAAVDGFDLDPRLIARARRRLAARGSCVRVWVGDAAAIAAADASYQAAFDFGVLHHVADWRRGVAEIHRVLRPGGRFYAEEILAPFIRRTRHLLAHPQHDRFDAPEFRAALAETGFQSVSSREIGRALAWFVATRGV